MPPVNLDAILAPTVDRTLTNEQHLTAMRDAMRALAEHIRRLEGNLVVLGGKVNALNKQLGDRDATIRKLRAAALPTLGALSVYADVAATRTETADV